MSPDNHQLHESLNVGAGNIKFTALACISGVTGWHMIVVGGGRRSLPSHDGDFVITHPTRFVLTIFKPPFEWWQKNPCAVLFNALLCSALPHDITKQICDSLPTQDLFCNYQAAFWQQPEMS